MRKAKMYVPPCKLCGGDIDPPERYTKLKYLLCLDCGEEVAKSRIFTVAPMHKSNYVCITNLEDLKGLNNKGGLIK